MGDNKKEYLREAKGILSNCEGVESLMAILVAGGAGYIGSHTCVELLQAGY